MIGIFQKGLILFILLSSTLSVISQTGISDCCEAMHVCDVDSIPINYNSAFGNVNELESGSVSNPNMNVNANPGNAGCLLLGENQSHWIILTIATSGVLEFSISSDSLGYKDWNMWSYDSTTCLNILAKTQPPVACNWNASGSSTGMASFGNIPLGGSPNNYENSISVTAGEQYVICFNVAVPQSAFNTYTYFNSFGSAQLCGSNSNTSCSSFALCVDSLSFQPVTCNNVCDGIINISTIGQMDSVLYTVGGMTSFNGTFNNLCPGSYSIQVEDSTGCIQYASVNIENPVLTVPLTSTDTIFACDYFCDTLTGLGLVNYYWIQDTIVGSSQNFLFCDSVPASLELAGIDGFGCPSDTVQLYFENSVYGIDSININSALDTIPINGSTTVCLTDDLTGFTVLWDNGSTDTCVVISIPLDSLTICAIVTDSCGRTNELCYTVYEDSNININEIDKTKLKVVQYLHGFLIEGLDENENVELIVFDSQARMVYFNNVYRNGEFVNTDNLAHGVYYLRLNNSTIRYFRN